MILTDYYRFVHLPESKSKYRFDAIVGTATYLPFERIRNKERKLFIYHTPADYIKAKNKRKADYSLNKGDHISSLYVPDVSLPLAWGDVQGTADAILLVWEDNRQAFELFVSRGQKHNALQLYHLLADGQLNEEIAKLKAVADGRQ